MSSPNGSSNAWGLRSANQRRRAPGFTTKCAPWAAILMVLPLWAVAVCAAQSSVSMKTPAAPNPSPAPFAGAIISEWRGPVQVTLPAGVASLPVRGRVLPAGTIIDTREGQLILVIRADESDILVQPHTRIVIRAPQPGNWDVFEIFLGRVRAFIRKRTGADPPFQIGTPTAVIAVRGTKFDVEVNRTGITEVDVFEGLVEVGSIGRPGTSVLVRPGFSTRVGIGTAPETPVPSREIRPDVEAPSQMAKLEYARERALQIDRSIDAELGERADLDAGELIDESRESEKGGKH